MKSAIAVALLATLGVPQGQPFRSSVEAVRVDVLVTDGNGAMQGLTAEHFTLTDSGVPQRIDTVTLADVPLDVTVVLDTSASVTGRVLESLQRAAQSLVEVLTARDRASVITFSSRLQLTVDAVDDPSPIVAAIGDVHAGGGTALFDAVFAALALRDMTPVVRHVVIVFSDGEDTASWLPAPAVLEKARRTDAVVFAIVHADTRPRPTWDLRLMFGSGIQVSKREGPSFASSASFLDEITAVTGGTVFRTTSSDALQRAFARVISQFRTRYVLTYTPQGVDRTGWHPVTVQLKGAHGTVRARRGYQR